MRRWMVFLSTIVALFTLPIFYVESGFLFVFATLLSSLATLLSERRSFRLSGFAHNRLAALVKEVWGALTGLGVPIVPGGKVIL